MSRPVALPRKQTFHRDKSEDDDPLKCSSTPQSPTNPPQGGLVCLTPPPVPPKKWSVKKNPEGCDSVNVSQLKVKLMAELSVHEKCKAQPPPKAQKSPKQHPDDKNKIMDAKSLSDWWENVSSWTCLCKDLELGGVTERKIIKIKAEQLYKAIQRYIFLWSERGGTLKEHTAELLCIADNLDKVSKGTKIAGITGGATTVAGGVAAAAGVILSPFTLGASLALTAVGVGVAAAGGVTGASAAIANKVNVSQDEKKIEKVFQEYNDLMKDIQDCLKFINEGIEQLKKHDLSVLSEARTNSVRVARVVELAAIGGGSARAMEANSEASGLMQGFALGMDKFFTKGKDGQKLKRGLESKFAKKIREIAECLNKALNDLMQLNDLFSEHCSME